MDRYEAGSRTARLINQVLFNPRVSRQNMRDEHSRKCWLVAKNPHDLGSHLDMLHNTPLCMGIAHEAANRYWVFGGLKGSVAGFGLCPSCGNKVCDGPESCFDCPGDCGQCDACEDGFCKPPEDCLSCAPDCP